MGDGRNAKIAEQEVLVCIQEDIFRLHIAMDQAAFVGVLQTRSNLLHVGHDLGERYARAMRMTPA